jgi:hypothetical protein
MYYQKAGILTLPMGDKYQWKFALTVIKGISNFTWQYLTLRKILGMEFIFATTELANRQVI